MIVKNAKCNIFFYTFAKTGPSATKQVLFTKNKRKYV